MTTRSTSGTLCLADVQRARRVVSRYLPVSPLVEAPVLSEQLGCQVWLKLDSMLPTGAFKVRGGLYLLSQLTPAERGRGIVAATRGNHGQSLAFACRLFGVQCRLYVPLGNSTCKNGAMRRLGAQVIEIGADFDEACDIAARYSQLHGSHYVHPGKETRLFAGVGTWALEVMEQSPVEFDAAFVPVGVGSCLAGAIPVFQHLSPRTTLTGVAAAAAPGFVLSVAHRSVCEAPVEETLADGLAVRRPPEPALRAVIESGVHVETVDETEIDVAMRDLVQREGVVVEGASATTLAAARRYARGHKGASILLMVTGRNVDPHNLARALREHTASVRTFVAT